MFDAIGSHEWPDWRGDRHVDPWIDWRGGDVDLPVGWIFSDCRNGGQSNRRGWGRRVKDRRWIGEGPSRRMASRWVAVA